MDISVNIKNENTLVRVFFRVWVFYVIYYSVFTQIVNNIFERKVSILNKLLIFKWVPVYMLHVRNYSIYVCLLASADNLWEANAMLSGNLQRGFVCVKSSDSEYANETTL